jgi:predicted  nucleic acid-binding Zn-ribbon protein
MADDSSDDGLRRRLARSGEDALGKLAQDLLENQLVNSALTRAFEAREKAAQAQEVAMGALNLPSAADLERLTRRVRSLSQRLEGIEDGVDRLDQRLAAVSATAGLDERLAAIERALEAIAADVQKLSATPRTAAARRASTSRSAPAKRAAASADEPTASRPNASGAAATPAEPTPE